MKLRPAIAFFVIASLALCGAVLARGSQKKAAKQSKPTASQASDQQMTQSMPGAEHTSLAKLAGDYTTSTKLFMTPGAPPQDSAGEAKLWMTLDGRFLSEDDSGMFFGQPTKGFKMVGYNNSSKRYEGIWTYTMSTSIMTLNGTSRDGGKTITFGATFDDQAGKQKLDIVMRKTDDDHFVVELSGKTSDGKPGPRLETVYTRKK